jgi:hypothetical protein
MDMPCEVFYHQLVMEFAPTYSFDLDFPAPPIYTSLSPGNGMSTVRCFML